MLLLNVPPNREGLLSEPDLASLRAFRSILNETFRTNLAAGYAPAQLTDNTLHTALTIAENQPLLIDLKRPTPFDRAMLQENIADGQRLERGKIEYWDGKAWQILRPFTTVGYKRLLRFPAVTTTKVRVTVTKAKAPVKLAAFGLFKASDRE